MSKRRTEVQRRPLGGDANQQQAIIKLVWGSIVFASGVLGIFGIITSITILVVVGGLLDGIDSIIVADMGGIISAVFFALAGTIVCFAAFAAPWWYGLCAGLCFESAIGGAIGYGLRAYNFTMSKKGSFSRPEYEREGHKNRAALKRTIKRGIREFIERL